jgi:hypothetical protein
MTMTRRLARWVAPLVLLLSVVTTQAASAAERPTLRLGDRGPAVVRLQERLQELRYFDVTTVDGVFGPGTLHGVVAFQKVQHIARDGVVGPATWARLDHPSRPAPRYTPQRSSIEVDLSDQVVYYVRDGRVRGIADSSTGSGRLYWQYGAVHQAVTPIGRFRIYSRYAGWQESPLGWMYRPHYFFEGYAIHGSTFVPAYPDSHGCVRVTVATMDRLAPKLRIGMRVSIYR